VFLVGRWVNGEKNAKKWHQKTLFFDAISHVLTNFNACRATLRGGFSRRKGGGIRKDFEWIFFSVLNGIFFGFEWNIFGFEWIFFRF